MGGLLLHLLDFNQDAMARKILASKRQVDGEIPVLEAPRNSLEMQVETTHNFIDPGDDLQQVEEGWSENRCFPMEAPVKRLINEEMSRNRKSSPSIVARLMGVEMLPLDNISVVQQPIHRRCESMDTMFFRNEKIEIGSADCFSSNSCSSSKEQLDQWSYGYGYGSGKPTRREHPQEEELQKFKKEFEACQTTRFKECSRVAELVNVAAQLVVPKQFNKQGRAPEAYSEPRQTKKSTESTTSHIQKETSHERCPLQHQSSKMTLSRTTSGDTENHCVDYGERLQDKSSAQTRIVILKPGPDGFYVHEEGSWTSSPAISEERGGMENFLQEVKERLTCELEGKAFKKKATAVRGSGIETPFREMPLDDPKQIARDLAKHVRESVGTHLIRSESTRSSRSEMQQFSAYGSPEFMNRDTRRFLSERLKNVVRRKQTHWEIRQEEESETQTGSFRHGEYDDDVGICKDLSSPKNLIRSLSAPVSGTSFGKLLLEDRHVLTGAQIRRKHESLDSVTEELKKQKKERFNIRQKVSSFRHNFTLRRMLFAKRYQRVESFNYGKDIHIMSTRQPTVMNIGERQITMMENSTEVPPSPASICSSQDDFWCRPADCLSPISTPDVTQEEDDNGMPQAFRDICSNLKELRRQINRLGSSDDDDNDDESVLAPSVDCLVEPREEIDDEAEAYIRDLLIASGLYDGSSSDICLSKPIPDSVFEQVEEATAASASSKKAGGEDHDEVEGSKLDGKILYDLLNEVLASVALQVGQRLTGVPWVRRNVTGARLLPPLRGRKLLERVWKMIREYVYPTPSPSSLLPLAADAVVERHLGSMNSWSCGFIDEEEVDEVGKELQFLIVNDLIDEAMNVMCRAF